MSAKTIFIIIISVLVTIILMNNTDEVNFWIFGDARVPKLAVLGVMFALGLIVGFVAGRPRKKSDVIQDNINSHSYKEEEGIRNSNPNYLSDEDQEYIK